MEQQTPAKRDEGAPSPEELLLLSTAKLQFDHNELNSIKSLSREVTDWSLVTETAQRKFSATYLHRALLQGASEFVPPEVMSGLAKTSEFTKLRTLRIAAELISFHKSCIEPVDAKHAYLKGIALPLQFNGSYVERYCRDIDILVAEDQFEKVIHEAMRSGYKVLLATEPIKYVATRDDLMFLTKFRTDIGLISPKGTLIEVHRRLDKSNLVFDVDDALDSVSSVKVSNITVKTLRPSLHFAYACYHHSRHYWSHLHWLADLDLMLRSEKFDLGEINQIAETLGLTPTISASISLANVVSNPSIWSDLETEGSLTNKFLRSCLLNLHGDLNLEHEMIKGSFTRDFISEAQISAHRSRGISASSWKKSLDPSLTQYLKRPLPVAFFWIYRLERAMILLRDGVVRNLNFLRSRESDTRRHADG
ncbi:MAG: nucleotidyltransferase family protein [Pseudomonadota bacterium]